MLQQNPTYLSLLLSRFSTNFILQARKFATQRSSAHQPWLPNPPYSSRNPNSTTPRTNEFTTLRSLLANPDLTPGPEIEQALDETGIVPSSQLLEAIMDHADSSPKPLFSLFRWAERQPGFDLTTKLFNEIINTLAKAREFDLAWTLLRDRIEKLENVSPQGLVPAESFVILMRRYARAGMASSAIRTFEYVGSLGFLVCQNGELNLFEVLLDALCKEGHVSLASDYFDRKMSSEPDWAPSIKVCNILLNGWFRMRNLKKVERLWTQMRKESVFVVAPTVVTFGTLVDGYCRMGRVERAMELVEEMKRGGLEPNAVIYNSIVDALAEQGRFKEALGILEWFLALKSEECPTLSTYNSLVKGFCKAEDLAGASQILKMMTSRGIMPTTTTYNYFFRYFSKHCMINEGMNLYTKMIDAGHVPDRLTFHLIIKMLCEREKLDWAVQVSKDMRVRGCDMDLATGTMLTHLYCKKCKWKEAFCEFKDMIRRGIVPQYLTYQRMTVGLRTNRMVQMAQDLSNMMASVPHSKKLPNTYRGEDEDATRVRRKAILQRAKTMSDVLGKCSDPRELSNLKRSMESANRKIERGRRGLSHT